MRKLCLVLLLFSAPLFAQNAQPAAAHNDRLQKALEAAQETKSAGGTIQFAGMKEAAFSTFSFGVTNVTDTTGGSGGGVGKVQFSDFVIVKKVDASSTKLLEMCASGKHIPQVTLQLTDEKGQPFLVVKLSDVLISSYQLGNGTGSYLEGLSLSAQHSEYILIGL